MGERQKIEFDIDRYLRNSKRLELSELPWDDIPNLMDIETLAV
jgi:hypothetical protein